MPRSSRELDPDVFIGVLRALVAHPEADRIHRAAAQYLVALTHWRPGHELMAVAHLWMGLEAMTPVALRGELARRGVDRKGLLDLWGIDVKKLDPEVRRRLLFREDNEAYKAAVRTSDGFEHGFEPFPQLHPLASRARDTTASILRRAIAHEFGPDIERQLLSPPYETPKESFRLSRYLRATLIGDASKLAAGTEEHPIFDGPRTLPASCETTTARTGSHRAIR